MGLWGRLQRSAGGADSPPPDPSRERQHGRLGLLRRDVLLDGDRRGRLDRVAKELVAGDHGDDEKDEAEDEREEVDAEHGLWGW